MKITIESTGAATMIEADSGGVPVRVWRGTSEDGTPVHAFIALLAVPASADQGLASRDLAELEPFPAPSPASPRLAPVERPGALVFADDPRAAAACQAAAAIEPSVRFLAEQVGWEATLDALATVYLNEAVRRLGPEHASASLARMRDGVHAVAESQRAPGLSAAARQGRA